MMLAFGAWFHDIKLKGGFYSESAIRFLDLQISKTKYSEKLSWAWNLNLLFTVFGGKFKFQAQDSFSEYFFWRFGDLKNASHFLKKATFKSAFFSRIFLHKNAYGNRKLKELYSTV